MLRKKDVCALLFPFGPLFKFASGGPDLRGKVLKVNKFEGGRYD